MCARSLALAIALCAATSAHAADPATASIAATPTQAPAVDGVNFKVDVFGGAWPVDGHQKSAVMGMGSVTIPVGHSFGLQIDLGGGEIDGDGAFHAAGHAFWRDPSIGLLGLYVSQFYWDRFNGLSAQRGGVEIARYWSRWTLAGLAGIEGGKSARRVTPNFVESHEVDTNFFDQVSLSYYLTDNFRLVAGHAFEAGLHAAVFGAEWGLPLGDGRMMALYAEGRLGEEGNNGVWSGLRFYFGEHDKSLIERHRQDDPPTYKPPPRQYNIRPLDPY